MPPKREKKKNDWQVYLLRCRDETIYTGVTNDIKKRMTAHQRGTASKYTRSRLPVRLLKVSKFMKKADAMRLEIKIKKLPKKKKIGALD
ncbi:MAG TPA: GIY-YIG nuclease family protein [Deltaproteobacteria bacterium]|nr:GIY-YIG nuclease family protein [Deltaproteobacteria bacterium]